MYYCIKITFNSLIMKVKLLFLALLSFLFVLFAEAQENFLNKVIYIDDYTSLQAYDMCSTFDSEYILSGQYFRQHGLLIKFNSDLEIQWNKTISYENGQVYLSTIKPTVDQNYIICGTVQKNGINKTEPFLMKINGAGDTLWTQSYSTNFNTTKVYSTECTLDSGYLLGGRLYSDSNLGFISKIDKQGQFEWMKSISMGSLRSKVYSVKQSQDLGYYVCGAFTNIDDFEIRGFMLKLDNSGEVEWAKEYYHSDDPYQLFYCTDFYEIDDTIFTIMGSNYKTFFCALELSGDLIWNKTYDISVPNTTMDGYATQKVYKTDEGNFGFISGESFGSFLEISASGEIIASAGLELNPSSVIKLDNQYLFLGNGPLMGVKNVNNYKESIGFIKSLDNGGSNCSYGLNPSIESQEQLFINNIDVSLANEGFQTNSSLEIGSIDMNTRDGCVDFIGATQSLSNDLVRILPNPNNGTFNFSSKSSREGVLVIINTLGQVIYTGRISEAITSININPINNGIYFYKFKNENQQEYTGRLIIQK